MRRAVAEPAAGVAVAERAALAQEPAAQEQAREPVAQEPVEVGAAPVAPAEEARQAAGIRRRRQCANAPQVRVPRPTRADVADKTEPRLRPVRGRGSFIGRDGLPAIYGVTLQASETFTCSEDRFDRKLCVSRQRKSRPISGFQKPHSPE